MRTRSLVRAASRDEARRNARYNTGYRTVKGMRVEVGGRPRTVDADAQPECVPHHRKLPCGRCPEAA